MRRCESGPRRRPPNTAPSAWASIPCHGCRLGREGTDACWPHRRDPSRQRRTSAAARSPPCLGRTGSGAGSTPSACRGPEGHTAHPPPPGAAPTFSAHWPGGVAPLAKAHAAAAAAAGCRGGQRRQPRRPSDEGSSASTAACQPPVACHGASVQPPMAALGECHSYQTMIASPTTPPRVRPKGTCVQRTRPPLVGRGPAPSCFYPLPLPLRCGHQPRPCGWWACPTPPYRFFSSRVGAIAFGRSVGAADRPSVSALLGTGGGGLRGGGGEAKWGGIRRGTRGRSCGERAAPPAARRFETCRRGSSAVGLYALAPHSRRVAASAGESGAIRVRRAVSLCCVSPSYPCCPPLPPARTRLPDHNVRQHHGVGL